MAIDDDDSDESDGEEDEVDQLSSDQYDLDFRSSGLDIPKDKNGQKSDDDGGLGESLGTMSISPARMSISVGMRG